MRHCHFQDVPGRRSLCLRTLHHMHGWEDLRRLTMCDDDMSSGCPHRGWNEELRESTLRTRSRWLEDCACGGNKHDTLRERLQCMSDQILLPLLDKCPPHLESGCSVAVLPPMFPPFIRERAWRLIRAEVVRRDGQRCQECGRDLSAYPAWYAEVHHIVPVAHGGSDHPSNLVTLCTECHGAHTDHMTTSSNGRKGESGSRRRNKPNLVQSRLPERSDDEQA